MTNILKPTPDEGGHIPAGPESSPHDGVGAAASEGMRRLDARVKRMPGGPADLYADKLAAGEISADPEQARIVRRLDRMAHEIEGYPDARGHDGGLAIQAWRIAQWLGFDRKRETPRGLYLWGGVGRGKSMLMDIFFEAAPIQSKRRTHFHEFMLDVHARLKRWRAYSTRERVLAGGRASDDDPIPPVAREIAQESTLLCFDELQVTDIADAMVLSRLFSELWSRGVIVVATSNRPPQDLYKDGLNRQLFLPFIDQLEDMLDVMALDSATDYRMNRLRGMPVYLTPINKETTAQLSDLFFKLTDWKADNAKKVKSSELLVQGRRLFVPKAARGVAVFSFKRLCGSALGSADYLAIAKHYHTVILVAVPKMGPELRNEAKRFVTLIDALYEHGVKFFCNAEVSPEQLYTGGTGAFEFERTVSRLMEMQSQSYLERRHALVKILE